MTSPLILQNRHTGETLRMHRTRDASGETVLMVEGSLPPGKNGPPPHVHFQEREEGAVKAGILAARVGKDRLLLPVGGTAAFPAGVVHSWWNGGEELLELSGRVVPVVDLDRYLQALFAVLNASVDGRPSLFYLAHVLWRHRRTQAVVIPPRAIQRILFPAIILLGHALGKYRGTTWPGSPDSCPGAPDLGR